MRVLCSLMFAAVALPAIAQAEAPPPTVLATVEAVAKAAGSESPIWRRRCGVPTTRSAPLWWIASPCG